jgi:ribosomal protein RSM22 (predicted rRNA methylase)
MIQYAARLMRASPPELAGCPAFAGHDTAKMISPSLPLALKAALDAKLEGAARRAIAARAEKISRTYRDGGGSGAIATETDALAYAAARMPATYAAVGASLNALNELRPEFSPKTVLDVGAGPGTASFAAAEAFTSLKSIVMLDANDALRTLALDLAKDSPRFAELAYRRGDAKALLTESEPADLVIASYVIGELGDAERRELANLLWTKTHDTLVVVEPGTPAGYARIIALRAQLIEAGAHVAAPCPHDGACPLTKPDWCHFTQRLPRSRAHKEIKGVDVPFEDEKFSYVVLSHEKVASRRSRVLAQPVVGKVEVAAKLCTAHGVATARVPHRDRHAYAQARRWRWGDAVMDESSRDSSR